MLQLIFQSPLESDLFSRFSVGDDIVFLENALFFLLKKGRFNLELSRLQEKYKLYVLKDELAVRGINSDELVQGINVIDYTQFVQLTVTNQLSYSWT
ncbi:MAG: sulfurtransferase complex subunit TusB [Methylococcaceae bacterium]